jgi:2,3-bisphosphoglycerate-independent phosphoglycerate mutase
MGFDTVKAGIATRLNTLGYTESSEAIDFKNAPANEYENRYIIKCLSGEQGIENVVDRFYDNQEWQVLIAFKKSENNDIMQIDALHRLKDLLLADLDDPANWYGIAKILKYKSWTITEASNYFVLDVKLSVLDQYIY